MKKKQVNIVLEENIYKELKINSVVEGFSMKKYIEIILKKHMEGKSNPKNIQERLYNSYDLSLFLQCERRTITNYYKSGKLKGVMYGNEYWSTADQVKEFLNNRKEKK